MGRLRGKKARHVVSTSGCGPSLAPSPNGRLSCQRQFTAQGSSLIDVREDISTLEELPLGINRETCPAQGTDRVQDALDAANLHTSGLLCQIASVCLLLLHVAIVARRDGSHRGVSRTDLGLQRSRVTCRSLASVLTVWPTSSPPKVHPVQLRSPYVGPPHIIAAS